MGQKSSSRLWNFGLIVYDVCRLLRKVRGTPKYDQKYHNWKCKVEGTVIEGETAIIVVAITGDRELSCITIYDK
jgi:hypothetical protein